MTTPRLRVIVADDERPARSYLMEMLRRRPDIELVGEAASGIEAVAAIERAQPDVAFLDLHMPELDGLGVVRALKKKFVPLVIFVTAHEGYALRAFELNAVDYLLKPVSGVRLSDALARAHERLERADAKEAEAERITQAVVSYEAQAKLPFLERIPVRRREVVTLLPVRQLASIVAERELLHLTTARNERHTITYRLKDLEARLDPAKFVRLGRGAIVAVDMIAEIHLMPGGGYAISLTNGQELPVSRIQSRTLRERLLQL